MNKNPYIICTHDPNSNCKECNTKGKLDCKLDKKQQMTSMKTVFSYVLIAILGLVVTGILTGNWIILIIFLIFIGLFFFVIEIKINCSHCPYYAENKKTLNCPGNNFFPKLWKYNPKPISLGEQIGSIIGFGILGLYPFLSELYGIWFVYSTEPNITFVKIIGPIIILIATIVGYMIFISLFLFKFCPKCVNFSCRFNKVPQEYVDEYLKKNPVIRDAWKKSKITKDKE
jgi:hypothetical protein